MCVCVCVCVCVYVCVCVCVYVCACVCVVWVYVVRACEGKCGGGTIQLHTSPVYIILLSTARVYVFIL